MVDDVEEAVDFYTTHFGFDLRFSARPGVRRRQSRRTSACCSAGRPAPPDARCPTATEPGPGGWNSIHFIVEDLPDEVDRLRAAGSGFATTSSAAQAASRSSSTTPPATSIELFQPA